MPPTFTPNADGSITIAKNTGELRTFTIARLMEIVAVLGTYYRELTSPYSATAAAIDFQFDCLNANPPRDANGDYYFDADCVWLWDYANRHALYDFVEANSLFTIARNTPTIVVSDVLTRLRAMITPEDFQVGYNAFATYVGLVQNTNYTSESARDVIAEYFRDYLCTTKSMTTPWCYCIWEIGAEDYGFCSSFCPERCEACPGYAFCQPDAAENFRGYCMQMQSLIAGGAAAQDKYLAVKTLILSAAESLMTYLSQFAQYWES